MARKLTYLYGAMNCGKSTHLLQVAHNYEERGLKVKIIKPMIDTKANDCISSRLGIERKVDLLIAPKGVIQNIDCDLILVDEAQFLTQEQVGQLYYITKYDNIPVMCYGLRCDFQMNSFPGSQRLLEIADEIHELKTICRCGSKATQNLRLLNGKPIFDGAQVEIDNQQDIKYESVCGKCYLQLKEKVNA